MCVCICLKAWKERYFVLQDGKLIYYKDRKKVCTLQDSIVYICKHTCYVLQADPPQGIIDLAGATVTRNSVKREHGLDIIVSLLHFCCGYVHLSSLCVHFVSTICTSRCYSNIKS